MTKDIFYVKTHATQIYSSGFFYNLPFDEFILAIFKIEK
jgi:hypothetical protein